MKRITLLFLFLGYTVYGRTQLVQNNSKNSIDATVDSAANGYMKDSARVGLSIGVYQDGKTYTYNYGTTEKGKDLLPAINTLYEIGSITKTFTGTLLAQAVVDKKVKLDDDIRKYLDGKYPNLVYKGYPIKLYQLINHTSGLPFLLPDKKDLFQLPQDSIPYFITTVQNQYSKDNFLQDLHTVQLDTIPGVKFSYSNAAAQLLGYILEKVYGKNYENLIKKFIVIPQKMPLTKLTYLNAEKGMFAKGYNDKGLLMPYNPDMIGAAGNIKSTVTGMLNYIKFHLDESNPVIKLSHAATFGDINSFAIGLNWQMIKTKNGYRRIWQSGGTFGFSSYCVVYPELNTGIILLSNESDRTAQSGLEEVANRIFEEMINAK
ncbi:MAG TPA: serine hydrolase domain-containing protein [Niastella sp.]